MSKQSDLISVSQGAAGDPLFIDTANNRVGMGTSSPAVRFHVTSSDNYVAGIESSTSFSLLGFKASGTTGTLDDANVAVGATGDALYLRSGGTERARIDALGSLLVGTTSSIGGAASELNISNASGSSTQLRIRHSSAAAGRHWRYGADSTNTVYIINQDSTGVYIPNGSTAWIGLSDERYKDIIEPISNAVEKVTSLRAVIGKFKTDEEGKRRSFLIAQDVQAVLPEAVDETNPERLGLAPTDVIPLLVAAIKEQQAIIEALEARITALEA